MATPKKKHLIELMIEAGVKWPDGAEYAAQDKHTLNVNFYHNGKPDFQPGDYEWMANDCRFMDDDSVELDSICRNWHQTIVTREQYADYLSVVPGWNSSVGALMDTSHLEDKSNQVRESHDYPAAADTGCFAWHNPPSIEQLTADYHAKAAGADRLQAVADDALKAADDALLALEKAGELLGLVISIDTKPKKVEPAQPEITDWRDLLVGDVIFIGESSAPFTAPSGEYQVVSLDFESETQPVSVEWGKGEVWPLLAERGWRFIRRQ